MTRRRLVALVSALSLLVLAVIALVIVLSVTRTTYGRDKVRSFIASRITARVKGTGRVHIGAITGSMLGGVTIDSLEIRDVDDSLFIATGPITVEYDIRDFLDRRILLERLEVQRPIVRLAQDESGEWNYRRIFPKRPRGLPSLQPGLGDFIVIDTASVRGGYLIVTQPWHPPDTLRGQQRDSAIASNIAREDAEIRRRGENLTRTRRWSAIELASSHVRWAHPDSIGRYVDIRSLSTVESDPPVRLMSAEGNVKILADSLWLDVNRFSLPGSRGAATGKVVWGSSLPTRYYVDVTGDSVSLNDVAWVYPTLPTSGGGKLNLEIRSRKNPRVIDYVITDMDVTSTKSRLKGAMTFGVGNPTLEVTNVALEAAPLDFALIEQLSGGPLPVDWRGTIRGTARGRGGPVTRFVLDDAQVTFADANVPGAITRASARGELDIVYPSLTAFHGLEVDVAQLDLRTPQFLFPAFPRLGGTIAGRATLDSSWLDVRFRDADIVHTDGPASPTRVQGSGRVTYGDPFVSYDVNVLADSLSFTTLARSYPGLTLRGNVQGPIHARGNAESLEVTTTLSGPAGQLAFDGRLDTYPPGLAARGRASITNLDIGRLLARTDLPATSLSAEFEGDLMGDSLANLVGPLAVDVGRSRLGAVTLRPSQARLRFAAGRVRVEEAVVVTNRFNVTGTGALGTSAGVSDSLSLRFVVDSLGSFRPWLAPVDSTVASNRDLPADSLGGNIEVLARLVGGVGRLDVNGTITGTDMVVATSRAGVMRGEFAARDLLGSPSGELTVRGDTVTLGGMRLASLSAMVAMADTVHGRVRLTADGSPRAAVMSAGIDRSAGRTSLLIDTLSFTTHAGGWWRLASPGRLTLAAGDLALESLTLRGDSGGRIVAGGTLPAAGTIDVRITGDSVDLRDVRALVGYKPTLDGWADLDLVMAGTRAAPTMRANAELVAARFGSVQAERLIGSATYADRRLNANIGLFRHGARAVDATVALPVNLAIARVANRLLDEPLSGEIRADSVDLQMLEAFTTQLEQSKGRIGLRVALGGTARRPLFNGGLTLTDATTHLVGAGITLQAIHADVRFLGDSLAIQDLSMRSVGEGDARLAGTIRYRDVMNPVFNLQFRSNNFQVMNRPRVAILRITSGGDGLTLRGPLEGSQLSGEVTVTEGSIIIPDVFSKRLVDVRVDTDLSTGQGLLTNAPSRFVENLLLDDVRIGVGNEVWLRSSEANIKLGGEVNVRTVRAARADVDRDISRVESDSVYRLALEGALSANRGTYRLNLGVVQRTFQVEQGNVAFFGEADLNPTLDIYALYAVPRAQTDDASRDVRVRVHIYGTLAQPQIQLTNADETIPMSDSDLLSYLVTGAPSFELSAAGMQNLQTAASILLPTLGSFLSDRFRGSNFDLFQLEAASFRGVDGTTNNNEILGLLLATRLGVGKQLSKRTFLSANTNLCQLGGLFGSDLQGGNLLENIGLTLEHQLNSGFSAALSLEPGSSAMLCRTGSRGFLSTPPQFGADLFKRWTF
jgi:translocation and assembly module TamB